MLYFSRLKIISIIVFCLSLIFFSISNFINNEDFFLKKKVNLGLDLQGGSYLLLEVDKNPVINQTLQSKLTQVRNYFKKKEIKTFDYKLGKQKVLFKSDTNDQEKILELFKNDNELNPYFDVYKSYQYNVELIDNIFELTLTKYGIIEIEQSLLDQAIEIVRKRVDEVGTNEPSITKSGSNRIAVELPGLDNPDRIKSLLGRTANLTFRFVTQNTDASFGSEKLKDLDTGEELNVSKRIIISGDNLIDAKPQMDNINNETVVSFTLDRLGARKFGRATKNGIGKQLAIVLDNQIISAPVIRDVIASGSGQISGGFTFQSATDLALLLRSGALPAPLDIIEERTVGPDLGEDSIKAGVLSLIIGFILVILYMIYKYRLFGLISNFALIINLFMLLGFLTIFEATLTLPGIAGIILTVGMAVDANVLIFERIREEIRGGRSVLSSVESGYKRAIGTIVDASLTTLIASACLYGLGSGPIKGFAVTLSIGILTSMFTAIMVTRMLVVFYLRNYKPKKLII